VWKPPAEMAIASVSVTTLTGVRRSTFVPSPS
jgi:hypothetical protein